MSEPENGTHNFSRREDVVFARVALRTVADFTASVFSRLQQLFGALLPPQRKG